ncbi:MAG: hypothetical protein RID90_16890 [Marinovum algicola]|jgi:DNA-directed RNA polymerase subunit RPC12/RpoP|uniref:hypothetical protein n=1 Tax=Marinovum algicola TaxID=42444 RepID=UPI0032ED7F6F
MLPQLPGLERPKRKPPRVMAKVADAGGDSGTLVVYECSRCGWRSGWLDQSAKSNSDIRKGYPCPTCNQRGDRP